MSKMMVLGFFDSLSANVKYFSLLIGALDGSSVDFQWADGRHNMWDVILRSGHHPGVVFENRSNPHRVLLVGNVFWAAAFF